jgi:DNA-binding response OmpR family regulator
MNDKIEGSGKQILCIEANEDCRVMMNTLLGLAGYRVVTAATVRDGLSLARHESFDLIIVDGWLDDGTGVDLCRRVRRFDDKTPILLHSSLARKSDIEEGVKAGAQGYVIKPHIEELEPAISNLLNCAA